MYFGIKLGANCSNLGTTKSESLSGPVCYPFCHLPKKSTKPFTHSADEGRKDDMITEVHQFVISKKLKVYTCSVFKDSLSLPLFIRYFYNTFNVFWVRLIKQHLSRLCFFIFVWIKFRANANCDFLTKTKN